MSKILLVTGSSGLIGSEVVAHFAQGNWAVHGVDNNMRAQFFGPQGDTRWNRDRLIRNHGNFSHHEADIRDRAAVQDLVKTIEPDAIVHCAAQPSHDLAASRPFDDFDVNAGGTLNLLEAARRVCPEAPFVYMSTNKVYGDAPNEIALVETETRWDYGDPAYAPGIPEIFRIDRSKHSLFGASKVAADILVQEYGRYFGMPTCCLRGGCLTGPHHSGVELHGFLSFLVRCNLEGRVYKIYGYKGKQVRDNIHSFDVARFIERFIDKPRSGEVYNIGGGRANSISILEAFAAVAEISGKAMRFEYVDAPRSGDHICYISDLTKMREHYPGWEHNAGYWCNLARNPRRLDAPIQSDRLSADIHEFTADGGPSRNFMIDLSQREPLDLPDDASLPRLLYFADVPVEAGMHGSALMYRLLEDYPQGKLLIVEGFKSSSPDRRIADVRHELFRPMWSRALMSRFHYHVSPAVTRYISIYGRSVPALLNGFCPEAVVTVAWGYCWLAAAAFAERANLPLHLIVHDDWPNFDDRYASFERRWKEEFVQYYYPKAASRLCVSPYMEELYRGLYGASGDVLYPSRAKDCPAFAEPPDRLTGACDPFTVAFAGTIYPEHARALRRCAFALRQNGGRLLVYGPPPSKGASRLLQEANIELRGVATSQNLVRQCREEAHAMYIPMSYRVQDCANMKISFPSKLADSTAVGLPLIIDGPEYCSAVRWARDNPGVAEVTTGETVESLIAALARLRSPEHRLRLATEAIGRGNEYFAWDRAVNLLRVRLSKYLWR